MRMLCKDMLALGGGGVDGGAVDTGGGSPAKLTGAKGGGAETKNLINNCLTPTHPACNARLTEHHFIGISDTHKNCVWCYPTWPVKQCKKQVVHFCKQCGVYLHIDCFESWHTKLVPKSARAEEDRKNFIRLMKE